MNNVRLIKYYIGFLAMLVSFRVSAQDTIQHKLSLQDAIKKGLHSNTDIQKQNLEIIKTRYSIKEAKSAGLPQITGSLGINDNLLLAKQLLPGEFFGQPGTKVPVTFGTKYVINGNAQLQQLLYSRQYKVGLEGARKSEELVQVNAERTKQDVIYDIATTYYQALITNRQKAIIEANLARIDTSIRVAEVQYKNDIIRKIDVDQLRVDRINILTDLSDANIAYDLQLEQLKVLIGHPLNDTLILTDRNDFKTVNIAENTIRDNPALTLLEKQKDLKDIEIDNIKAQYYPTLSGTASYGFQSQTQNFKDLNTSPNSVIGLNISIPIFDGSKKRYQVKQREVELESLKLDQQLTENQLNVQYKQAINSYVQNKRSVEQQKANLDLAQNVYDVMNNNYKQGISNLTELINTETTLRQAQTRYLTALLQLNISELDVLRANGNMEDLLKNK